MRMQQTCLRTSRKKLNWLMMRGREMGCAPAPPFEVRVVHIPKVPSLKISEATLGGKWLELLSEITPGLKRAAIMFNPDAVTVSANMPSFEMAARSLKVAPIIARVHGDAEIETVIT